MSKWKRCCREMVAVREGERVRMNARERDWVGWDCREENGEPKRETKTQTNMMMKMTRTQRMKMTTTKGQKQDAEQESAPQLMTMIAKKKKTAVMMKMVVL